MMTAKHIDHHGAEQVVACSSVQRTGKTVIAKGIGEQPDTRFVYGSVFVMNEGGHTIATYRLGEPDMAEDPDLGDITQPYTGPVS